MPMRLSGLMSGMDTESIVSQLVEARKTKVTKAVKAQKSLGFKQEAWKSLNSQILKLYDGALSNMRFESAFTKKTTKISNSSVASVITGAGAMNSVQEMEVHQLAKSGYLSGGKMELLQGAESKEITRDTKLSEIGFDLDLKEKGTIMVKTGGKETQFTVNRATTLGEFVDELKKAGVNASLDTANGRIYVAAQSTGLDNDFTITAGWKDNKVDSFDENGQLALEKLGLVYDSETAKTQKKALVDKLTGLLTTDDASGKALSEALKAKKIDVDKLKGLSADNEADLEYLDEKMLTDIKGAINAALEKEKSKEVADASIVSTLSDLQRGINTYGTKVDGSDSKITLNGMTYTSSKNTLEVNGLTITALSKGETTLTTENDTDGIYDMVKNFFKEYNALINQMDKLYNAESASEYEPLTDEEKEAMSDSAVEQWEQKIKDSILRRDSSLNTIASAMKQIMLQGVEVNGKTMYLSSFGIGTLSYFNAAENEKNAYHIDGDSDDSSVAGNADKLKSMIASDPDTVVAFFTGLSKSLHGKMTELMAGTEYSSAFTAYEDKRMKTEYDEYKTKIKELEKKLADYEDQWYAKFAAMETAMAKMQSNASAVTSLLGGS